MFELHSGPFKVTIDPKLGGAVTSFSSGETHWLRPAKVGAQDPRDTACFPMVPFANRIAGGRFTYNGKKVQLPRNDADRHALHGFGWMAPWQRTDDSEITHSYDGDGPWPWAYKACQRFRLDESGLEIELQLTNLSNEAMPAGLGLHPYFPEPSKASLHAAVTKIHEIDRKTLSWSAIDTHPALDALVEGGELPIGLDHYFEGWDQKALIDWGDKQLLMEASNCCSYLTLYTPKNADFFCVEPVQHPVNAHNSADPSALIDLMPKHSMSVTLRLKPSQ